MKYTVIPQVYTIVAFGALLVLMPFYTGGVIEPWMDGLPWFLVNPVITVAFCLWLSIAIVWFIAFALSLRYIRKKGLKLTEVARQNQYVVFLATFTVVVALSGCVGFSRPMYVTAHLPPLLSTVFVYATFVGVFGTFLCVPAWIIVVLWRFLSAHRARP